MGEYVGMKVCDLRFIRTVEEAKEIGGIVDVELLVLPNDAPAEVAKALAAIPKTDVRQVIQLGSQEELDVSKYIKKTVTYKDVKILDLRSITTVEAAEAVKEIKDVKVLIVPADGPDEVRNTIMAIPQKGVGKVLRLRLNEEVDYSKLEEEISMNEKREIKYHDMNILDLRDIKSVEVLQNIRRINDICLLVLPKDAPPEIRSAIMAIPQNDIIKTIYLKDGEDIPYQILRANGVYVMKTLPQKNLIIKANGICMISDLSGLKEDISITLKANGICLLHTNLQSMSNFSPSINGITFYKDFDPERVKINNEMEIEAATLSYLPENTFLIVGNLLTFAEDVTPEMLMEKNIQILAGNDIAAPKHLIPYLSATATVGNKIVKRTD